MKKELIIPLHFSKSIFLHFHIFIISTYIKIKNLIYVKNSNYSFNLIDKNIATRLFGIPEDDIKGDKIIDSAIIKRKEDKLRFLQHKTNFEYVVGTPHMFQMIQTLTYFAK